MIGSLLFDVVQDEARNSTVAAMIAVITKRVLLSISLSPLKVLLFKTVIQSSKLLTEIVNLVHGSLQ